MKLEEKVMKEVDSWNIQIEKLNGEEVKYHDLVKPIFYSIGIDITRKIIGIFKGKIVGIDGNSYLELNLEEAIKRFRLDYVLSHLNNYDFNISETARQIAAEKPESMRIIILNILKENNLNIHELKENKERYIKAPNAIKTEVLDFAEKEIMRYKEFVNYKLLKKLITKNSREIAKRFAKIIINPVEDRKSALMPYLALDFKAAQEAFKSKYLKDQFYKNNMNSRRAAEASGKEYGTYRTALYLRGIKTTDLRKTRIKKLVKTAKI